MDYSALADLLYPGIDKTPEDYELLYPARSLPEGAKVTRFAPSPTGYMHLGNLFSSLIDFEARGKNGIFYLRIEDTDKKREVADAIPRILGGLAAFGIVPDEGVTGENEQKGAYGPYKQSTRKEIYQACAKRLVQKGLAYPCFCSEQELNSVRERQEAEGENPGYYGKWAKCRELSFEEIKENILEGKSFVLRLRSPGDASRKIFVDDLIKGKLEMPENILDAVLIKADGIPPYAFAHAVDDHFMRTTHVVRGDEWIASLPLHIQIFAALGYKPPKYVHISPIMKLDGGNKRKLSKRKDPEAAVSYYIEEGYPEAGVTEYLLTIANSNFEDWRRANPASPVADFPFNFKKMSASGALFDLDKLNDVSKNVISRMSADTVFALALQWAKEFDEPLYSLLSADEGYARGIFSIDRGGAKPRKDIAKWNEVRDYVSYFYDGLFDCDTAAVMPEKLQKADICAVLDAYAAAYDENDTKDEWFERIKSLCAPLGFTPNVKEYKAAPEAFKGHVGDVSSVIRVAVTGRTNTPDLYEILKLLGRQRVLARLNAAKG